MEVKELLSLLGSLGGVFTTAAIIIKPIREKLLGLKSETEGVKCLLRVEMLRIYYLYREERKIRQFEYESFMLMYKAYKALGGNSVIDHIKAEVDEWEIIS